MTNEELTKYLYFLNEEYGDRGWEGQGQMSLDAYGPESLSGREGWEDILKDQLKYNQFDSHKELGLLSNREDIEQVLRSRLEDNPNYPHINFLPTAESLMRTDGVDVPDSDLGFPSTTVHAPQMQALESSSSLPLQIGPVGSGVGSASYSSLPLGPVGSDASMYGVEGATTAADTAASGTSAWGGPATFAGNMALNMIPTRDRNKVGTPLGDEGSISGILKGGGKGALLGATIGSAVAPGPGTGIGAAIGGGLGVIGGAQGYFDSTTPPQIQIGRIKRLGGRMPQGLLGGGIYA
jgi:hypothetical protein